MSGQINSYVYYLNAKYKVAIQELPWQWSECIVLAKGNSHERTNEHRTTSSDAWEQ
jgi:hypothetical protein